MHACTRLLPRTLHTHHVYWHIHAQVMILAHGWTIVRRKLSAQARFRLVRGGGVRRLWVCRWEGMELKGCGFCATRIVAAQLKLGYVDIP